MKHLNILFIYLITLSLLSACNDKDENEGVKIDPPVNGFSFKPAPGGAVMHYTLPDNDQITGIQVVYNDENGKLVRCTGSATNDSVSLVGFNHAQDKVEAQAFYIMRDQSMSAPIDIQFSTLNSASVEFLNSVNVISNWNGFSIQFKNNAESKGMVHVFYLGIDPLSHQADTILMNSFYLEKEDALQTKNYRMEQNVGNAVNVVVRAEDFRGNMVGEKAWKEIPLLEEEKITWKTDYDFYCDNIVTDEVGKTGIEYLFDGDLTGISQTKKENYFEDYKRYSKLCTFIAGPDAFGDNAHPWYIDLKSNHVMANIKMYAMLSWWDAKSSHMVDVRGELCDAGYYISDYWENRTPCEVTIYGMKDNSKHPSSYSELNSMEGEWVEIGTFYQSPTQTPKYRYCPNVANGDGTGGFNYMADMEAASPEFLEVVVPAAEQNGGYRFLKIVINDTFRLSATWAGSQQINNNNKYVICQELEVYTAKK